MTYRSLLFVPATDPELDRAAQLTADAVVVDLEHVPDDQLPDARAATRAVLDGAGSSAPSMGVRISELDSGRVEDDLDALLDGSPPDFLVVPDVRDPGDVRRVADALPEEGSTGLLPLLEHPRAIWQALEIAEASEATIGLCFGPVDYANAMERSPIEPLDFDLPRALVALGAKGAEVAAYDMPTIDTEDDERVIEEATEARRLGYDGKIAMTRGQAREIERQFPAPPDAVERAREILDRVESEGVSGQRVDGRPLTPVGVERLRRIVERADQ